MSRVFTLPKDKRNVLTDLAPLPPLVKGDFNKPDLSFVPKSGGKMVQGAYFCGPSDERHIIVSR